MAKKYIERTFWVVHEDEEGWHESEYGDSVLLTQSKNHARSNLYSLITFCPDWFFRIFGKRLKKSMADRKPRKMTVKIWK